MTLRRTGNSTHFSLLGLVLLLVVSGTMLQATVVPRYEFGELIERSTRIVHARCVMTDTFMETESGTIWTRNYFEVLETLKGEISARIVVMEPGGVVGTQGQWVPGAPQFAPGDESVLFLGQTVTGKWRVFGWGQGNYRIQRDLQSGQLLAKPDLAGIEMAAPTGAAPEISLPTPAFRTTRVETLEGLKDRIRTQLQRRGLR